MPKRTANRTRLEPGATVTSAAAGKGGRGRGWDIAMVAVVMFIMFVIDFILSYVCHSYFLFSSKLENINNNYMEGSRSATIK